MKRALFMLAACGSSAPPADASFGTSPVTCTESGAGASGTLSDAAGVAHPFGPAATVSWFQGQAGMPGGITLDDGTTKISIFGPTCDSSPTVCPPPVGDYTETSDYHRFQSSWFMGAVSPATMVIHVDVAQPHDPCWGGRYDITYSLDHGDVAGEITGWWVNT